ncbi:MAG TPA: AAA family ATPase [Candidatus Paceibacterota bacterium]|nr:AAA family ATPase [Candidatus Paceibacterota bacterium]
MNLIGEVKIKSFRSCADIKISCINEFNAFLGLNNSGKSNILRALNLFFNGEIEPNVNFILARDGNFPEWKKEKKEIMISLTFNTSIFKNAKAFKKSFLSDHPNLKDKYTITKIWNYKSDSAGVIVGDMNEIKMAADFLKFINFRYLVAHRDPIKIIKSIDSRIRKELLRRFSSRANKLKDLDKTEKIFNILKQSAESFMSPISDAIKYSSPEIKNLFLSTPKNLRDLATSLSLIYSVLLSTDKVISEELQGSGLQSYLMFRMLCFADTSYSLDFGWKLANIWAIEEPESFLHTKLEIDLARFFRDSAKESKNKLQIFCTTHSEIFPQYVDNCYFVSFKQSQYTNIETGDKKDIIYRASENGISSFVHALHRRQDVPIIVVEGESDKVIIEKYLKIIDKEKLYLVCDYNDFGLDGGGKDHVVKYLKDQKEIIEIRQKPVFLILDWIERVNTKNVDIRNLSIVNFKKDHSNDKLSDECFRGIEKFLPESIIEECSKKYKFGISRDSRSGEISIKRAELEKNKNNVADYFSTNAKKDDIVYLKKDLAQIFEPSINL